MERIDPLNLLSGDTVASGRVNSESTGRARRAESHLEPRALTRTTPQCILIDGKLGYLSGLLEIISIGSRQLLEILPSSAGNGYDLPVPHEPHFCCHIHALGTSVSKPSPE
jgi:hypothetical protein